MKKRSSTLELGPGPETWNLEEGLNVRKILRVQMPMLREGAKSASCLCEWVDVRCVRFERTTLRPAGVDTGCRVGEAGPAG